MVTTDRARATLPARMFGSDLPATGEPATLAIDDDRVTVRAGERAFASHLAELSVREIGFGSQRGFELAWREGEAARAVHLLDTEAVRTFCSLPQIASLPKFQALERAARRRAIGRSIGWAAIAAFVLLPVIAVVILIWRADSIAEAITRSIPIEQEVKLGETAFASLRPTLSLIESGPAHEAVVDLGKRLTQGSQYQYQFFVARDETVNAFALPGGIIVVHTGLIEATKRAEELAGVLAHEIQHVEQRHSLRAAVKELGLRGAWAWLTGDLGGTLAGEAALDLTLRKFSRDDESEADAKAFDLLVEHGIDPSGMIDFFTTLAGQGRAGELPEFLSTHPASEERRRALLERLDHLGRRGFSELDREEWPPAT